MNLEEELKKRKLFSKKMIVFGLLVLIVCVTFFVAITFVQSTLKTPNSGDPTQISFVIESGQGLESISKNLVEEGLIKNHFIFGLYLKFEGRAGSIQAGEYLIAKNLKMTEVADIITKGNIVSNRVTFPEGWTIEKIADRLAAKGIVSKIDFINAAKKDYDYWFLKDKPLSTDLEGFLYPDTYEFAKDVTADQIVKKMLDNFDKKMIPELREKAESSKMNFYDVVKLAAIVEREVAKAEDRKLVASVFLNRLSVNMALESCATIQYITGENKTQFTIQETRIESPFNTYINRGLTPKPIGNPSIDSITAVLDPKDSDYLYFLSADGKTYFSYTLDEHNQKKAIYLR
ncbi:MAG: endolytic transglycosylase MltG [Patescibacteria group bacterium]|nr:endolytic transglycosylase MltG [Patescibacteria group bacterium]